jgi:hypothetical protein
MNKEEQVLLDAVNAYLENRKVPYQKDIDWNSVTETAMNNGVANILSKTIRQNKAYLERYYFQKNEKKIINEIIKIKREFERNNVNLIFLKGITLKKYYQNSDRQFGDIDILVKKSDLPKAEEILFKNGFSLVRFRPKKVFLKYQNHLIYTKKNNLTVEVHWNIFREDLGITHDREEYWKNVASTYILGEKIPKFNPEYTFLELIAHFMDHWLCLDLLHYLDIALVIKKSKLDWNKIILISKAWGISSYVYHTTKKIKENFNVDVPDFALKKLKKDSSKIKLALLERIDTGVISSRDDYEIIKPKIAKFIITNKLSTKFNVLFKEIIIWALFPPKHVMAEHFNLKESSPLIYPCYLLNPFRIMMKTISAVKK